MAERIALSPTAEAIQSALPRRPGERNPRDVRIVRTELYYLPIRTRVPLKFGTETLTSVTCARACVGVMGADGREVRGWGETPISVQWVWPSTLSYQSRHEALKAFCELLAEEYAKFAEWGHALEIGYRFQRQCLPELLKTFNKDRGDGAVPYLAALLCCSPFDIALHDAYGKFHDRPTYETYDQPFLTHDLSAYFNDDSTASVVHGEFDFTSCFPAQFLESPPVALPAWHLVGGLDPLNAAEINGQMPDDEHPVLLRDWIDRDGLTCLKVKLRGDDATWDFERLVNVGNIALEKGVEALTADFNCTVKDPSYVIDILRKLESEHAAIYELILYVEQPFPYDLEQHAIDVSALAAIKPLFMDESAHDWMHIRLGRSLGWNGVALKTCKTQTAAILSLCWAKAHGMALMVQDLTNPMLAQIPHVLLAAHAGTLLGVETNAMQFYPAASDAEAEVHAGLYRRRHGKIELSSIQGAGFGYRIDEIQRELPQAAVCFAD